MEDSKSQPMQSQKGLQPACLDASRKEDGNNSHFSLMNAEQVIVCTSHFAARSMPWCSTALIALICLGVQGVSFRVAQLPLQQVT